MQADLDELKTLHSQAQRPYCKDLLAVDIRRLESEIHRLAGEDRVPDASIRSTVPTRSRTKIDLYGWGQSERFVNLYISDKLKELKGLPAENVTSSFTDRSVQLEMKDLHGRDYFFNITNLCETIVPDQSNHKLKSDSVVLNLRKKVEKDWPCVTAAEKAIKEKKKVKDDHEAKDMKSQDPQASLMGLMKKMYEDGDDETKRTISKSWFESSQRKTGADPML